MTAAQEARWPLVSGELATRIREFDWACTPLGPTARWSPVLRATIELMLAMPNPAFVCWGADAITLYNDAYSRVLVEKHPEALGKPFFDIWPELSEMLRPHHAQVMAGESQQFVDTRFELGGRGEGLVPAWFTASWTPIRAEDGQVAGFFCSAIDTTDKVLAEQELRDNELRLRLALDVAELGAWHLDMATGEFTIDERGARIVGLPPELSQNAAARAETVHPDDYPRVVAEREAGIARGGAFTLAYRVIHPDGSVHHVVSRVRVIQDDNGTPIRLAGTNRDMTAEREAEERQAFVLRLADAIRPLSDAGEIVGTATRLIGEHLNLHRAYYALFDQDLDQILVEQDFTRSDAVSLAGRFSFADFAWSGPLYESGEDVVVPDVATTDLVPPEMRVALEELMIISFIAIPLVKDGRLVGALGLTDNAPRAWTPAEASLARETGERIWAAVERARAESALRASEERYRSLFESMDEGFALYEIVRNADGEPTDLFVHEMNRAYSRLTGRPNGTGRMLREVYPQLTEEWIRTLAGIAESRRSAQLVRFAPDTARWFDVRVMVQERDGTPLVAVLFSDITERRTAEEQFRTVVSLVPDLLWQSHPDGSAYWYNSRWTEYTGQSLEDAIGWGWTTVIHPDDREASAAAYVRAAREGRPLVHEHRIRSATGDYRWFLIRAHPVLEDGEIARWFGAATDIHEQRAAREELAASVETATAELRTLSRRLMAVQEEERRMISRDLHDNMGQLLTGLDFQLGAVSQGNPRALAEARQTIAEATNFIRSLSMELRPPTLDHYGLRGAMPILVQRFSEQTGISISLNAIGLEERLHPDLEVAAYRIVQEALTNIARHAGVDRATVLIAADAEHLRIVVSDSGAGFDSRSVTASGGLTSMRERAELVGGQLRIVSTPGAGVSVHADLPVIDSRPDDR
ncbi:MAG: PAS domain-containing protein [Chloroflexota bacterium]|nr:PAS domain-containing protein [Chloroflexota bacterium]